MRYAARRRGIDNMCRARTQAERVHHVVQFFDRLGHIKRCVVDGGLHQVAPQMQGASAHVLLPGAKSYFVNTGLGGLARFAKTGARTGHVLQFQANVFQNMGGPGAFLQSLQKAAAHAGAAFMLNQAGQVAGQAFVKAGQGVGREIF